MIPARAGCAENRGGAHGAQGEEMTAEIAILNKMAVALVADSAVTISARRRDRNYLQLKR